MDLLLIKEGFPLLSFLIFMPLAGSVVLLFFHGETFARLWAMMVTSLTAVSSLFLLTGFDPASAKYQFAEAYTWIPRFHINYIVGMDGISILLVLLTTFIMPFCVLASWKYIQQRVAPFMFCLLIMETSMIGVFVALDFVLFYIFWEFMLIPMYLLIAIWGGPRKVYASIKFFLYTLAGSVLLLVAIIALYLKSGSFFIPEMMCNLIRLRSRSSSSSLFSSPLRSRCRCFPSIPGCRPPTSKHRPPVRSSWPRSC